MMNRPMKKASVPHFTSLTAVSVRTRVKATSNPARSNAATDGA